MASNQVTVAVTGGPSAAIPWQQGMNAQNALEAAWNQINNSAQFTYGLQYYGTVYGYLLFMINETYDSFLSSADPFYYWEFFVNGAPQNQGIDSTTLNPGDTVTFTYSLFDSAKHAGTTLDGKARFQKKQVGAAGRQSR